MSCPAVVLHLSSDRRDRAAKKHTLYCSAKGIWFQLDNTASVVLSARNFLTALARISPRGVPCGCPTNTTGRDTFTPATHGVKVYDHSGMSNTSAPVPFEISRRYLNTCVFPVCVRLRLSSGRRSRAAILK